jgi:hypothetical protein
VAAVQPANVPDQTPAGEDVMHMVNLPIRDRAAHCRESSDLAFIVWAAIAAIGLIVVSFALVGSVGLAPDQALSIFASP